VILTGKSALEDFKRKYADARKALDQWQAVIERNGFRHFPELKAAFPSVDYVKNSPYTVFDIRGNKYRLAVIVVYRDNRCIVEKVMTHQEYTHWCRRFG
jgi:mRNA interferase HigB